MFIILNIRTATAETSNGHSIRIFSDRRSAAQYITDRNLDADRYKIYEIAPEPEAEPERESEQRADEEYLHFNFGAGMRALLQPIQTLETRRVYYVKELITSRRYDAEFENPADAGDLATALNNTQGAYVWTMDVETRYIVRSA